MVFMNNTVWIIMRHHVLDYTDCNIITMICATEELARTKLKWFKENKPNKNFVYWIEEYDLETP